MLRIGSVCLRLAGIVASSVCCFGCCSNAGLQGRIYWSSGDTLIERSLDTGVEETVMPLRSSEQGSIVRRTHYDVSIDGRFIAYVERHSTSKAGAAKSSAARLVVFDSAKHKIVFSKYLHEPVDFPVSLSPDSKMLAVVRGSSVPMLSIIRLSDGRIVLSSIPAYNGSPSWSPDGTQIAVADVNVRPVLVRLSDGKRNVLPGRGSPMWSPDGKFVAVDRALWHVRQRRIEDLKLPPRAIVTGWTPDSKALLFTYEDQFLRYPLFMYQIGSAETEEVLSDHGGSDTYPTIWRRP